MADSSVGDGLVVEEVVGLGEGGGPDGTPVPPVLLDEPAVEDVGRSAPGGGPGGGPPALAVTLEPSLPESEPSPLTEPPNICNCDRIDIRPDIAGFRPVESTAEGLDVGSEVVPADVEAEGDGSSVAPVWPDAELL